MNRYHIKSRLMEMEEGEKWWNLCRVWSISVQCSCYLYLCLRSLVVQKVLWKTSNKGYFRTQTWRILTLYDNLLLRILTLYDNLLLRFLFVFLKTLNWMYKLLDQTLVFMIIKCSIFTFDYLKSVRTSWDLYI